MFLRILLLNLVTIGTTENVTLLEKFTDKETSSINIEAATQCLQNLTTEVFGFNKLIMILNSNITKNPGYTIMSNTLKHIHRNAEYASTSYEITNGERNSFKSFETCIKNCGPKDKKPKMFKRHFQTLRKADMFMVFIDDIATFQRDLNRIEHMKSYNMSSEFYMVYLNLPQTKQQAKKIADQIMRITYSNQKYLTKLLIPVATDVFELYLWNLYAREVQYCMSDPVLYRINTCDKGIFQERNYRINRDYSHLNCSIKAVLMEIPPFVISPDEGLEIKILDEIEERLNITFDKIYSKMSEDWGIKLPNGTWTGLMQRIESDPFNIGVGGVILREDRVDDFDYSNTYYSEKVLWIAPRAAPITGWRLLKSIFTLATWGVLVVIHLLVGVLIYIMSNLELMLHGSSNVLDQRWRKLARALLMSYQMTVNMSVNKQPKTTTNRFIFIFYAIFIMIMYSWFQSALINVLTHPLYEHQIASFDDVVESNMTIGSIETLRDIFDVNFTRSSQIYDRFLIVPYEIDTRDYWLLRVARSRNTVTILGQLYTLYNEGIDELRNADGTSKIYPILGEVVYIESMRFIFSKNFMLKQQIDMIIDSLLQTGFISAWEDYYINRYREKEVNKTHVVGAKQVNPNEVVLRLMHFEGAFMLLGFGCLVSSGCFVAEIIVSKIFAKYVKKKKNLVKGRWQR